MKAIQVAKVGRPEVLEVVHLPVPTPKPGEALVEIKTAGVNFIDIYLREGRYSAPLPFVNGQEAAGLVSAVGSDVTSVQPGDRVAYAGVLGSYAEYASVPAGRLVQLPAELDFKLGATAMLQGLTAHYLSHSTYPLKRGETALIHAAAGGVGLLLVQMAKNLGAQVIGTVGNEAKAELAREAGADEIIIYSEQDFEAETLRLTSNRGVDVIYDGVGRSTFDKDLNVLCPRGYLVLFGGASGPVPPLDPIILSQKGSLYLTRPTLGHYTATPEELQQRASELFNMVAAGTLKLRIHGSYALDDAQVAHRDLEGRRTSGKLLLVP